MSSSLIVDYLSAGLHKTRPGTDTVGGGTNRCPFLITLSVDCKTITSGCRFTKSEKPTRQASAMSRGEAEQFLTLVKELSPDLYPLFLMALHRESG